MANKLTILVRPLAGVLSENFKGIRSFQRWVAPVRKTLYHRRKQMGPQPPAKRSDFIEWNYQAELYSFGARLGEKFEEPLLREALTERSYIDLEEENLRKVGVEPQLELKDNREMAASGEAFLHHYSHRYICTLLPRLPVTHVREIENDLLKEEQLAHISSHIGINDLVLTAENPPSTETLSRSFKAVVEAVGLSGGRERAGVFVRDFVLVHLAGKDLSPLCSPAQPLEVLQQTLGARTESRLIAEAGRNSVLPNFQVGIYLDRKLVGRGCGESVEVAEEMAALDGLWKIWGVSANRRPIPFDLELPPAPLLQQS